MSFFRRRNHDIGSRFKALLREQLAELDIKRLNFIAHQLATENLPARERCGFNRKIVQQVHQSLKKYLWPQRVSVGLDRLKALHSTHTRRKCRQPRTGCQQNNLLHARDIQRCLQLGIVHQLKLVKV